MSAMDAKSATRNCLEPVRITLYRTPIRQDEEKLAAAVRIFRGWSKSGVAVESAPSTSGFPRLPASPAQNETDADGSMLKYR